VVSQLSALWQTIRWLLGCVCGNEWRWPALILRRCCRYVAAHSLTDKDVVADELAPLIHWQCACSALCHVRLALIASCAPYTPRTDWLYQVSGWVVSGVVYTLYTDRHVLRLAGTKALTMRRISLLTKSWRAWRRDRVYGVDWAHNPSSSHSLLLCLPSMCVMPIILSIVCDGDVIVT